MRIFSKPLTKLTILGFFGGGYVLGAKAGRERYEQIRKTAGQVKDDPRVQQATSRAEDIVRETATKMTEDPRVKEAAARAQDVVRDATATITGAFGSEDDADKHVSPPLADEHTQTDDEIVYSTGPDIEETIDELLPTSDADRL